MTTPPLPPARILRFRLEALGFGAMAGLIHALGPDRASALSGALWRKVAPFNKRHARAREQMAASLPEIDAATRERHLDAMWDNLGRTTAEAFHIGALIGDLDRFRIGGETRIAVADAKARGAVFVSLHQGNWELAAPLLHRLGLPVAGVYQRLQNPFVEAEASRLRLPFYQLGLHPKGHDTARHLLRMVGQGGTVTIMADLRDLTGLGVPFFGRPAPSTLFPALLARGRDVPLFAGMVLRETGATFRVRTIEIPVARTRDREADLLETTARIQACFEQSIREQPEQWMWGHRRWAK